MGRALGIEAKDAMGIYEISDALMTLACRGQDMARARVRAGLRADHGLQRRVAQLNAADGLPLSVLPGVARSMER